MRSLRAPYLRLQRLLIEKHKGGCSPRARKVSAAHKYRIGAAA